MKPHFYWLTLLFTFVFTSLIVSDKADAQTGSKKQVGPSPTNKQESAKKETVDQATDGPVTFKFEKGFDHTAIAIELSKDGTRFATGGLNKDVVLYDTKNWKQIAKSQAPTGMVLDLVFSDDGKHLISSGDNKLVLVFETKDLNVTQTYRTKARPERLALLSDNRVAIGGRSGSRTSVGIAENWQDKTGDKIHDRFIGGLASSKSSRVVYSAGDQKSGPYFLARKTKTLQKIVSLPGRPARVTLGRDDREILVTTETKALVVDVVRNRIVETWDLPDAKKVEDIIYWPVHDVYVTADKQGFVKLWMRGHAEPIAEHQISQFDVYQVLALDDNRLAFCGREGVPRSIAIWNLSFDKSKLPKPRMDNANKLADVLNGPKKVTETETPKDASTEAAAKPRENEMKAEKPARKPASFVDLNSQFEVKRISPGDLGLRKDQPSTQAELEWQVSQLEAAGEPVPQSLKEFVPLEILDAIVSPGKGTLYLATSDGLVSFDGNTASLVQKKDKSPLQAKCLARDAVDGILIGENGGYKVYELRESGKLVSRGTVVDEEDEAEKGKLKSVDRIIMSGSNYLALASSTIYRRMSDGTWVDEQVKTKYPIADFELMETGEIATVNDRNSNVEVHSDSSVPRNISLGSSTESNDDQIRQAASSSSLRVKKMIAGSDGELFTVFARKRTPGSRSSSKRQYVTSGCGNLYGSVFNDTLTYHDIDWDIAKPFQSLKTIVDYLPGPSNETTDVWFLTPDGLGRLNNGKTDFWNSQFVIEKDGLELSRIKSLGNGDFMVFTSDGIHGLDAFHIRKKK